MSGDLVFGVGGVVVALIAVVGAVRFLRSGKGAVGGFGSIVVALLGILVGAVGVIELIGASAVSATVVAPTDVPRSSADAARINRGEHLAYLCALCHSSTGHLPLDGGRQNLIGNLGGISLGTLYAPNLTPAGPIASWTDGQVLRAIRQGLDANGHRLFLMPSDGFHQLSDDDALALVAYLRSQLGVERATPARQFNPLGLIAIGVGVLGPPPQSPITGPVTAPPVGSAGYGEYLVTVTGCRTCHGANLSGFGTQAGSGSANGPNLTTLVPQWSRDQFLTTIRTGRDPNGYNLRPDLMPWPQVSAAYSDDELSAMYSYLHQLEPVQGR
jgi:mono/diheme cytochrome c family protein